MASTDSSTAGRLARMGMPLISAAQGLAALATALSSTCHLLAAVPFAWAAFLNQPSNINNQAYADFASADQGPITDSLTAAAHSSREVAVGGKAEVLTVSRETLVGQILAVMETVVGHGVGLDEPLMAAGLDSLGTVELRNTLEGKFGLQLPATLVFDYPSVAALADLLYPQLAVATAAAAAEQQLEVIHQHGSQHALMPATALTVVPEQGTSSSTALVAVTAIVTRSPQDSIGSLTGTDAVARIPLERWDIEISSGSSGLPSRFGAFLSKVDAFDASLFGLGGAEASLMDPQQRMLLEVVAEAQLVSYMDVARSSCGVFVGVSSSDYQRLTTQQAQDLNGYNATSTFLRYCTCTTCSEGAIP